jgi:hypothetical protein
VALKPDVIVAVGPPSAYAGQKLTVTIPIVFLAVARPVEAGQTEQILVLHETGENVIDTPARAADAPVASEARPHHERLRPAPHVGFGRAESRGQTREAVGVWQLALDCGCDPLDQVDHVDVQLRGACALIGRDHEIIASAK